MTDSLAGPPSVRPAKALGSSVPELLPSPEPQVPSGLFRSDAALSRVSFPDRVGGGISDPTRSPQHLAASPTGSGVCFPASRGQLPGSRWNTGCGLTSATRSHSGAWVCPHGGSLPPLPLPPHLCPLHVFGALNHREMILIFQKPTTWRDQRGSIREAGRVLSESSSPVGERGSGTVSS